MDTVSMLNKMSFYCQPILPLVYDESMSYYETLCKVVGQLNTTGETVNKLNEGLTGEIADRQEADAALDERLTGEISDRRDADAALNDKLTGEIADRYNADSLLNERLKVVEATNKKIHFLAFAGTPPHNARPVGAMPTRSELRQWINDRDMIVTVMETTDEEHNLVYATSCTYNAVNWTHETPAGFYIIVPISIDYGSEGDNAVRQKIAKITIPPDPASSLDDDWGLQFIEINNQFTGGKIEGNVEITGGLKVGMSSEFSSSIKAGSEISSDMLLMAPIVSLHDPATEESISFGVAGENAAKVTTTVSGGGVQYARLKVASPTEDNDAATKKYVDEHSASGEKYVVNITFNTAAPPSIIDDRKIAVFSAATDKSFAEISSAVAAGKNVYGVCDGNKWPLYSSSSTAHAFRGSVQLDRVFGSVGLAIANCIVMQNVCTVEASAGELPAPALDGSDNGKVPTVNGTSWEMKKAVVDDALSDTSANPVQNKVVTVALNGKASTAVASQTANGLMSAEDKVKLDGIEDGATRVIVDDAMSDTSTNPVQNKVVKKYIDDRGVPPVGTQNNTMLIQVVNGAYALRTKESIFPVDDALDTESKNAVENGVIARRFEVLQEHTQLANGTRDGLMSASDYNKLRNIESGATKTIVDAALDASSTNPVQNKVVKTALDGKAGTAVATTSANGLMSKDDKAKLDGVEAGANKTTVDAALDAASENPVQNKAVKAALDGKLSTRGGEISGHLRVGLTVSAEGSVSVGRTSADTGIHFEKASSDAGRISHGSDPMTGVSPIARLKVASPTEDDDAATKAYVDGRAAGSGAVRYDAAQTLTFEQKNQARRNINAAGVDGPQFQGYLTLSPMNEPLGTGVGLSPSRDGNNYLLDISDVNEGNPTLLTGVKTPTDADTNAAATVEYILSKGYLTLDTLPKYGGETA